MKKSEELMLLLDYNKIDVSTYHLRKQLDFDVHHPNTLLLNPSLEELAVLEHGNQKTEYYLLKNPLMYHKTWPKEIHSIEQFYVQTKESNRIVPIQEIIDNTAYRGAGLKRILQDIFSKYIYEYDQAYKMMLKQVKNMYHLLPKKQTSYILQFRRKWSVLLILFLMNISLLLLPSNVAFNFVYGYDQILYIANSSELIPLISITIGRISILALLFFFMIHYVFKSLIKEVEKGNIYHREFDEEIVLDQHQAHLNKTMLNIQLFISKIEEENNDKKQLLNTFHYEEKHLKIYKENLNKIHHKNDLLQKRKKFFFESLNKSFIIALFLSVLFIISMLTQVLIEVIKNV